MFRYYRSLLMPPLRKYSSCKEAVLNIIDDGKQKRSASSRSLTAWLFIRHRPTEL